MYRWSLVTPCLSGGWGWHDDWIDGFGWLVVGCGSGGVVYYLFEHIHRTEGSHIGTWHGTSSSPTDHGPTGAGRASRLFMQSVLTTRPQHHTG